MISGVVGGIGEYFGLDEAVITVIRAIWAFVVFAGMGTPLVLYIIIACIMPKEESAEHPYRKPWENDSRNFYQSNPNKYQEHKIKEAEPVDDENSWSDF